jgi:hypothetical protein
MGHTFERGSLGSDRRPATYWFPCGHLCRQPITSEESRDLLIACLTYQWNDPRSQDLDFRWTVFWDVIWKGMLGYVVLAEMWLATESYFGLGAVAVRPPPSSHTKKSTPAPS